MLQNDMKRFSIIISFIAGYLYISIFSSITTNWAIWFIGFASIFTAWVLIVNQKKIKESFIWLIAL